jgi:O-antigen/teichoic acid export membrane protein
VNSVAFPTIAAQGQHENYKDIFLRGIVYTASLTAPVYAGLAALSPDIVGLLLGETWLAAAPVISILAIGGFLSSLDQYNCNTRMILDRPHWQFYVTTANAITNIVVLLIFARYGLQSLAFALVAKTAILHPLSLGIAMKLTGLRVADYIKGIFPILFCALVMGAGVALLHAQWDFGHPALNLLVYIPCGVAIYGVLMLCLKKALILDLIDIGRHIVRKPV